jgi:hypothetical protein
VAEAGTFSKKKRMPATPCPRSAYAVIKAANTASKAIFMTEPNVKQVEGNAISPTGIRLPRFRTFTKHELE